MDFYQYNIVVTSGSGYEHPIYKRSISPWEPVSEEKCAPLETAFSKEWFDPAMLPLISQRNTTHSPLLRLPPEIRNKMYEYALGGYNISLRFSNHDESVDKKKKDYPKDQDSRDLPPPSTAISPITHKEREDQHEALGPAHLFALLKTCKQTYQEARLLFYQLNEFQWDSRRCEKRNCIPLHNYSLLFFHFLIVLGTSQGAAINKFGLHIVG
ncbi:hypothetical protein DM02DRAFT_673614 [Periconia macrospinosa]|uniref:DUF7730 domain-containing protein n=1 Tax=Periconia macrospinosa TaxID=97972 RepID=A0A2V1DJA9_9PLEO|nr:hypothetical protein DM02DRAFT_673614 [Periconia macrospinosa]